MDQPGKPVDRLTAVKRKVKTLRIACKDWGSWLMAMKRNFLEEPKDRFKRHRKARLCMVHEKLSKGSGVPKSAIVWGAKMPEEAIKKWPGMAWKAHRHVMAVDKEPLQEKFIWNWEEELEAIELNSIREAPWGQERKSGGCKGLTPWGSELR